MIDVDIDTSDIMGKLKKLGAEAPKEAKAAVSSAITRTKPKVSGKLTSVITDRYAIEPAQVKKKFRLGKAMIPGGEGIDVTIKGPRIGRIHFAHQGGDDNLPLYGKVLNASAMSALKGRSQYPGFIGHGQNSGSKQIFARDTKARLPISGGQMMGPSIPEMAGRVVDLGELESIMDEAFWARLEHEIDFRFKKLAGGSK